MMQFFAPEQTADSLQIRLGVALRHAAGFDERARHLTTENAAAWSS